MHSSKPRVAVWVWLSGLCASPSLATHALVSAFRLAAPLPVFHHELTLKVSVISGVLFAAVAGWVAAVVALAAFSILRSLGHEQTWVWEGKRIPFDDRAVVREAIRQRMGAAR